MDFWFWILNFAFWDLKHLSPSHLSWWPLHFNQMIYNYPIQHQSPTAYSSFGRIFTHSSIISRNPSYSPKIYLYQSAFAVLFHFSPPFHLFNISWYLLLQSLINIYLIPLNGCTFAFLTSLLTMINHTIHHASEITPQSNTGKCFDEKQKLEVFCIT